MFLCPMTFVPPAQARMLRTDTLRTVVLGKTVLFLY